MFTIHPASASQPASKHQEQKSIRNVKKTINAEKRNARKCTYIRVFTSSGLLHPNPNTANWGIGGSSRARAQLKCISSEWNCIKLQHMFIFLYFVNVLFFIPRFHHLAISWYSPPSPASLHQPQLSTTPSHSQLFHCNQSSFLYTILNKSDLFRFLFRSSFWLPHTHSEPLSRWVGLTEPAYKNGKN